MALFKYAKYILRYVWNAMNSPWTGIFQECFLIWFLSGGYVLFLGLKIDASAPVFAVSMAMACGAGMCVVAVSVAGCMELVSAIVRQQSKYSAIVIDTTIIAGFALFLLSMIFLIFLTFSGLPDSKLGIVFLVVLLWMMSLFAATLDVGVPKFPGMSPMNDL